MLTLVVIAKNEVDRIESCLRSVPFATEWLVLDSGSTDGTPQLARELGARVIETDWPGHVTQKNRALDAVRTPWAVSLDADERLSIEAQESLATALRHSVGVDGYSFARCSRWLGRPIRHGRWYPDRKVRVVRRGLGRWGGDDPHDQMIVEGRVKELQGDIDHFPYRSFSEHLDTINRYSAIHADSLRKRGVQAHWWDVAFRPGLHFVDAYLIRQGFRDGVPGLATAGLGATHVLSKWTRLWLKDSELPS